MTAPVMRLCRPTADQRELQSSARAVFQGSATAAHRGEAPGAGWTRLAESGFLGALLPEARGGLGLGCADLVLLTEQAGAVLLPGPVVETLWVGVPALAAHGPRHALSDVLSGRAICTAVDASLRAPDADVASWVVVPGRSDVLVPAAAVGVLLRVPTADRVERSFRAAGLARPVGEPLGRLHGVGATTLGRLGGAAYLLGIAQWVLDTTLDHVTARTQFGVPVGSFQAVRHRLSDVHTEIEFARSAVGSAACEIDEGAPSAATAVVCAAAVVRRAFSAADRHCLQAHGGVGFTWELPLHVHLKRGHTFASRFGSRRELETILGTQLLADAARSPRAAAPRPAM